MAEPAAPRAPPDLDTDDCLREYRHLFSPDILAGQVAFITGGGSGIGFRIAEIFMRHGCHTVIASRNLQRVSEASKKLVAATGQQCLPLSIDVRQPQSIVAAVEQALKEFGRIDILVNNAAGNFLCPASSLSFNAFKTVIDIDTIGTFNTSKVLFEKYFRDHGGVIVNITATLSYRGQALQVHAGSAKAAIGGKFAKEANQFEMIPLQRAGNKTEVAHSTLYLASPLSSYVTGTTLVVDGGSWLTSANNFPAMLGTWLPGVVASPLSPCAVPCEGRGGTPRVLGSQDEGSQPRFQLVSTFSEPSSGFGKVVEQGPSLSPRGQSQR
ncbi:peroxisomal 2,4-dienoyl-CoA reductase [(3E)-enoyl-CoA-producing] isoform X3 [Heliangelus exortis]|uniref:peroxisomal 2,4-dienoyl-CoA reductase [(3E)-enoyl-CoA-producing] isoform X3 n=1 Tax=Heliangelus exortis TaxID=472823 RepID=UPI003A8FF963